MGWRCTFYWHTMNCPESDLSWAYRHCRTVKYIIVVLDKFYGLLCMCLWIVLYWRPGWFYDINAKTASFVQLFSGFFYFSFYYYQFEETKNWVKYDKLGSVQIRFRIECPYWNSKLIYMTYWLIYVRGGKIESMLRSNQFCFQWQEKMRKKTYNVQAGG